MEMPAPHPSCSGFTLIELSIVLVIIGLIIGGVLVGRDLIKAAEIRSTLAQIEKYNAAVITFLSKYNGLPGDITPVQASRFGMFNRAGTYGDGDRDGLIRDLSAGAASLRFYGETHFFWTDLSYAGLIAGSFADSTDGFVNPCTPDQMAAEVPVAAIGRGNVIHVVANNYINYYMLQAIPCVGAVTPGVPTWNANLTPLEAQAIDTKADDGKGTTGRITYTQMFFGSLVIFSNNSSTPPGPNVCVTNAAGYPYNTTNPDWAEMPSCGLLFQFN